MKYVIIGNSTAAVGCVEGIRAVDTTGPITLISAEPWHTYARPLISYMLQGKVSLDNMRYRAGDFYNANGVTALLGTTALSIDPVEKTVLTSSGEVAAYDKLLIASGSKPKHRDWPGIDGVSNRFCFYTLDDALAIDRLLTPDSRVLVIGTGLIGLKAAEGVAGRAKSVTVLGSGSHVLRSMLEPESARVVEAHLRASGLDLRLDTRVAAFDGNTALLESGERLDFDILVTASGVEPDTALAQVAGAEVGRGIVIDGHCAVSLPDVYAAGDCTEYLDVTSGRRRVMAILPNAYIQGRTAGENMAGGNRTPDNEFPMNAIGFFGMHILSAGSFAGERWESRDGDAYKLLVTKDNRLSGFILIGSIERAGIYTALIRNQTPLDTIDFELVRQAPQLLAFAAKDRAAMLSGGDIQ